MKSPTADVQETIGSLNGQPLVIQHKVPKKRAQNFVAEARSQKRKKLAENGFKQESDDVQQGATITQEEVTKNPGTNRCDVCSFKQQAEESFSRHAERIQDLKERTEQLQKEVLMVVKNNTEKLNEVSLRLDGLESKTVNPLVIEEIHEDLSETKKAVEQIKTELHAAKPPLKEFDDKLPSVHMLPNDQLMEMIRQMSQEIRREYHEIEPCWFTDFKNKQKQ